MARNSCTSQCCRAAVEANTNGSRSRSQLAVGVGVSELPLPPLLVQFDISVMVKWSVCPPLHTLSLLSPLSFPVSRFRLLMADKFSTQGAFPNISNRCCLLRTQLNQSMMATTIMLIMPKVKSHFSIESSLVCCIIHPLLPPPEPRPKQCGSSRNWNLQCATCFTFFVACPLRNGTTSHTTKNHLRIA